MPAKNSIKQYSENGYYHIYNRGVEKRKIFLDRQDYSVFLSYLKEYLLPKDEETLSKKLSNPTISPLERDNILKALRMNNFSDTISLLAYCLMPNHFHFMIKQAESQSIDKLMNSLGTRYTMYFNKKHKRVGSLYQGVYKAVLIDSNEQLIHLSRYIHKQALALQGQALQILSGQPNSYPDYIGERKTEWIHPKEVLSFFSKANSSISYKSFVGQAEDISLIEDLILEED